VYCKLNFFTKVPNWYNTDQKQQMILQIIHCLTISQPESKIIYFSFF